MIFFSAQLYFNFHRLTNKTAFVVISYNAWWDTFIYYQVLCMLRVVAHRPTEQVFISSIPQKNHSTNRVNPLFLASYLPFTKKQSLPQSRQVPTKTFLALKRDSRTNGQQPSTKTKKMSFFPLFWRGEKLVAGSIGQAGNSASISGGMQCSNGALYAQRINLYLALDSTHTDGLPPMADSGEPWR